MKIVRRRRNYYLRIIIRVLLVALCLFAGIFAGETYIKRQNEKSEKANRTFICILDQDIEAGEVLEESDIRKVSVVKEDKEFVSVTLSSCIGKQVKMALQKDTILSEDLLCSECDEVESVRKVPYSYIQNTDTLAKGDYIDVRISFPNGADFVLLAKKEVLRIDSGENEQTQKLWLGVTEEEILRMSSGVVDAYLFDGAYVYAVLYMNELQEESIVNYPVNEVVEELIKKDPNIIEIAQNQKTYELRSRIYENVSGEQKESTKTQEEGLVYFN